MGNLFQDGKQERTPFELLLCNLAPQRDRAAERYEDLRRNLVKFFEWSSCFPAEDLADETLDRMGRILLDRPVFELETFLWGVAKKIRQESHKRRERIVSITDLANQGIFLKDKADVESEIYAGQRNEAQSKCLRVCLHRMNEKDRTVFLRYYRLNTREQREKLAAELGLTIGALRVRINRIKIHLQGLVRQCFASPANEKGAARFADSMSPQNRLVAGPQPCRKHAA